VRDCELPERGDGESGPGVRLIMIDNPPVNVMSRAVRAHLLAEVTQAQMDPTVRVIAIAAAGKTFVSGADLTVRIRGNGRMGVVDCIFGRVAMIPIEDDPITEDGRVDVLRLRPIARLGYFEYTSVESTFEMVIPGDHGLLVGLEGSAAANSGR